MSSGDDPPFLLPPYATQRMKGKKPTKKTPNAAGTSDVTPDHDGPTLDLLWTDKYSPKTEKEVAVMPAKKRVIKDCLQNSALTGPQGQYKCLVLTGPAGSGKSTLIRVLGRSMGYNVIEYSNPASSRWEPVLSTEGYENQINQFERFLQDAMKFQPLGTSSRSRIILLDEVPDLTSDHIKSRFHELLINCISSKSPFLLVIVVSDAWTDPGARRRTDTVSLNMRDIVPAALVNDERCRTIEFNPIAPGQLRKVLEEINDCEIMSTNRGVSKETIDLIVDLSQGDIRNAINTLQFYSIPISSTPTIPKKRKLDSDDATTSTTCDITARGAPLDLFHAVGKVLHRKRDERGLLDSKPEHILDSLPVAANLFIGYLHANYIDFTDNISQCAEASKWIAEADVLGVSGDWKEDAPAEYQALVAMHGIMRIPRTDVKRMYQFKKPAYIELPGESESRAPIKSVFGDIIEPTNDRWGDPADWGDPIRNDFSDEEYDNIFGDGEDLAALDVCP